MRLAFGWRVSWRLALLAALLVGGPAAAQPRPDSPACQRQCGAILPRRADNPVSVQTCLARCQALESSRRAPQPPSPARPRQQPAPAQPWATPPAAAIPGQIPHQAPGHNPHQSPGQTPAPTQAPPAAPGLPGPRYGAAYLATAPSARFGLTAGLADRLAAHRTAELDCIGTTGAICRLGLEFRDRCGAVAQGLIGQGLRITEDTSTYTVAIAAAGSGPTAAEAQRAALSECRMLHRGASCRIAASRCGPA